MPTAPAIGRLDKRLDLYGIDRADDGAGGFTRSDAALGEVWARVRPASANERHQSEKLGQVISHVVIVRWRADLLAVRGMRGKFVGRDGRVRELTFETAHDPDEAGRFLVITAREGEPR
ncbi:MAG: hypothetical protein GC206_13430 [Alphaproteobacteria bacterium]|nr:hypothetical protein [Alphaproteobacteria bacterium]